MSRGTGSNLTSKIYKLLDFVYLFFFNLYKFLFSNLKKKKKNNTTVITTTTNCYARVLGEAVRAQNS